MVKTAYAKETAIIIEKKIKILSEHLESLQENKDNPITARVIIQEQAILETMKAVSESLHGNHVMMRCL